MSQTPDSRRKPTDTGGAPNRVRSAAPRTEPEKAPEPYGLDLILIVLLLFAALAILALLGAGGSLLGVLRSILSSGFGWGAWLIPAGLFGACWLVFRTQIGDPVLGALPRLIGLELAALILLGLASTLFAPTLSASEGGAGGGLVGWGISFAAGLILPPFWQVALLLPLAAGLVWWGAGISIGRNPSTPSPAARPTPASGKSKVSPVDGKTSANQIPNPARMTPPLPDALEKDRRPKPAIAPAKKLTALPPDKQKPAIAKVKRPKSLPPLSIFDSGEMAAPGIREINQIAGTIEKTLAEFDVPAKVVSYRTGPTVTQFGVEPGFVERPGSGSESRRAKVRVSQISSLSDDLALALAAPSLRIEAPVPGQSYVGVEVPHKRSSIVRLRNVMESPAFQKIRPPLAVALGLDVAGQPVCADLAAMPHLLIAGTTGSGKSVCITTLTACLVANNPPEALRLVLIDPKMVELVRFNGLPHILGKVETDLERIVTVLRWCTKEMDRRYKLLEQKHARHLEDYNRKVEQQGEEEPLPRMVIVLDEMADLMMMAPDETERTLIRLAQMARAVGIHLVVATQRPSTDVVTGLIKANFPARIAFAVASSVDSRVILDTTGAESLLGKGDMLYLSPEAGAPVRLQGCYLSDREITRLTDYWKEQGGGPEPEPAPRKAATPPAEAKHAARTAKPDPVPAPAGDAAPWEGMVNEGDEASSEGDDAEIDEAIRVVKQYGRASASLLQRKMRLGYPRAAHLMDVLQERGLIGRQQSGGKTRELLVGRGESASEEDSGE